MWRTKRDVLYDCSFLRIRTTWNLEEEKFQYYGRRSTATIEKFLKCMKIGYQENAVTDFWLFGRWQHQTVDRDRAKGSAIWIISGSGNIIIRVLNSALP
jgi:hypothetical protein